MGGYRASGDHLLGEQHGSTQLGFITERVLEDVVHCGDDICDALYVAVDLNSSTGAGSVHCNVHRELVLQSLDPFHLE